MEDKTQMLIIIAPVLSIVFTIVGGLFCLHSICRYIIRTYSMKKYKRLVLDIISEEDYKNALQILEDEFQKYILYDCTFENTIGLIVSDLRNGRYLKYYSKPLNKPFELAKKIDTVLKLYRDKSRYGQIDLMKLANELGFDTKEAMTEQTASFVYGRMRTFFNGMLHAKDKEIDELNKKLIKTSIGKILAWLGWSVGIISGIITIWQYFRAF